MPDIKPKTTMMHLMEKFHSDDKCRAALEKLRWPNGVECPRCKGRKHSPVGDREVYDCRSCGYQFSVTSGTIFHDTHLPLNKWFVAIYLIVESKKGISANQIKRVLGVSYKTAWYLCHRIRAAMTEHNAPKLDGTVEIDETFVGGKLEGAGLGNYLANKSIVIGVIQRGGKVRLQKIAMRDKDTIHQFVREHCSPDTELIITDSLNSYQGLADDNTRHETVNHFAKEWVRGDIHTNGIENVWSLLKRSVIGAYHKVSAKHIDAYLDELEWRFNNRANPYLFRDTLLKLIGSSNLAYKELVAS